MVSQPIRLILVDWFLCWTKSSYLLVCPLLILEDTLVLTGIIMGMLGICVGMAGTGWMLSIWGWGNV